MGTKKQTPDIAGSYDTSRMNGAHALTDLADLDILQLGDEPQRLELIHPVTNTVVRGANRQPATLYVLSFECETMQRFQDEQINKSAKRGTVLTAEQQRERQTAVVARLLMARPWEHIEWQGQPLAFNFTNAMMLMTRLPWARRQVETLATQEAAYLGNSSSSSPNLDATSSGSASDREAAD